MAEHIKKNDPKTLMARARKGDGQAFSALYKLYFVPIFRYVALRVRRKEEAEDLAQTVFLKVYESLRNVEDRGVPPLAYFFAVARNTVIDHWRKKKEVGMSDELEEMLVNIPSAGPRPDEVAARGELHERMRAAIARLSPDQQEVVTMKFMSDLSNREVASFLGKTEEAVRQLQSRAFKALREILGGEAQL